MPHPPYLLEALVFILIGLSLRGVLERLEGIGEAADTLAVPVGGVVATMILSRRVWVFGSDALGSRLVRGFSDGEP